MARRQKTLDEMIATVASLAMEAGENGHPLLESGLMLIVRARKHPAKVNSLLASIGLMISMVCEADPENVA